MSRPKCIRKYSITINGLPSISANANYAGCTDKLAIAIPVGEEYYISVFGFVYLPWFVFEEAQMRGDCEGNVKCITVTGPRS